jgi:hypothetical protein
VLIRAMELVRLAWNVRVTSRAAMDAKRRVADEPHAAGATTVDASPSA